MRALFRAAAVSVLIAAGTAGAASAQTVPVAADSVFRATTVNLSAYGETQVAPDKATIMLGVQTEGATAAEAMRRNAEQMNQVIASLRRSGIEQRDIQTSQLSLHPQYVYQENLPPRLSGYQATNQVTITVRDLSRLGQAVDASVNAGATNVGSISFGLVDPTAAENAARREAVEALRAKADLYAQATGHRVARLVTLSEGSSYSPVPPPMPMMAMKMERSMDAATQVAPGELKVRVDISATYELTR